MSEQFNRDFFHPVYEEYDDDDACVDADDDDDMYCYESFDASGDDVIEVDADGLIGYSSGWRSPPVQPIADMQVTPPRQPLAISQQQQQLSLPIDSLEIPPSPWPTTPRPTTRYVMPPYEQRPLVPDTPLIRTVPLHL